MASVTVRFYSFWRAQLAMDSLALQAGSIDDALAQLEERYGVHVRKRLAAEGIHLDGKLQDHALILLNGTNVRNLGNSDLKEGDVLHVFPRAIGG